MLFVVDSDRSLGCKQVTRSELIIYLSWADKANIHRLFCHFLSI